MVIKLKEMRKNKSMSVRDLAEKSNIGIATISRIENGEVTPNILTICKLCAALNITINELVICEK